MADGQSNMTESTIFSSQSPPVTADATTTKTTSNDEEPLYLIRLSQSHESFRRPELESLAAYLNIPLKIHEYSSTSPFCIVSFPTRSSITTTTTTTTTTKTQDKINSTHNLARQFVARSILSKSIYHLYATGPTYVSLHSTIQSLPPTTWEPFETVSFKFNVDTFRGKRSMSEQREIVEGFRYLPFRGRIAMRDAQEQFVVFEEWAGLSAAEHAVLRGGVAATTREETESIIPEDSIVEGESTTTNTSVSVLQRSPQRLFFGRYLGSSQRDLADKHDLKKRPYISTTSMDAELALVTALLAHAGPGRLMLDPFVGTGGFMVAASELGAVTLGSDIDGRSFRGKGKGMQKGVLANFRKYGILDKFGDCITADLTNTPFRLPRARTTPRPDSGDGDGVGSQTVRTQSTRWLDGIICDPPYGVREGLKVLGRRKHGDSPQNGRTVHDGPYFIDGVPSHTLPDFVAPKRPYSFDRMLGDILDFAARTLVEGGRLAFWMPCANEVEEEFGIPRHPLMELRHVCLQSFNKWSRRLLIYQRVAGEVDDLINVVEGLSIAAPATNGHHADDLNQFRRMYFQGFNHAGTSSVPKNDDG